MKIRKLRRRGKELVLEPYITATSDRNEFGLTQVERPQPFQAASSDLGVVCCMCNLDFKYMPRGFAALDNVEEIFRCDVSQLAACSRMLTFKMLEHTAMRRMALSIVALHVAASIVDYYITKYVAKPMEQLQNLITQYALGLRRLEDEEATDHQATKTDPKVRAKRVTIRLSDGCQTQFLDFCHRSSTLRALQGRPFYHTPRGPGVLESCVVSYA